ARLTQGGISRAWSRLSNLPASSRYVVQLLGFGKTWVSRRLSRPPLDVRPLAPDAHRRPIRGASESGGTRDRGEKSPSLRQRVAMKQAKFSDLEFRGYR